MELDIWWAIATPVGDATEGAISALDGRLVREQIRGSVSGSVRGATWDGVMGAVMDRTKEVGAL